MPIKINISDKGKTWKHEMESEAFFGKNIGDSIHGHDFHDDLKGYSFDIKGASDKAGFPHKAELIGPELRRVLFVKGWGMRDNRGGARIKKTVRGKQLSDKTVQINLAVTKHGEKPLAEVFVKKA